MSVAQEGPVEVATPTRPQLPHYSWRVNNPTSSLQYITDHRAADIALSQLAPGPLGFDLEWRPNFRKWGKENSVALVQLANHDTILLLQVSAMSEFPLKLRELLGDPSREKAGVSIKHDCLKLFQDSGISTYNCVELALLARSVDNARWKGKYTNPIGLSHLLETYENFSLAKGKVQRSNWEARLSPLQQDYAANDACAGYVIYNRLLALARYMPDPNTLSPRYYSFSVVNGSLLDHLGISEWSPQNPHYDPGPPPPPKEPNMRKQKTGPPNSSATAANPRGGPSHRGPPPNSSATAANPRGGSSHRGAPHRYGSAGTNKQFHNPQQQFYNHQQQFYNPQQQFHNPQQQFHNPQQYAPMMFTTPPRNTGHGQAWEVALGEHDAAAGRDGRTEARLSRPGIGYRRS